MTIRSIWVIVGIVVLALAVAIVLPKPKEEHPPETATPATAQNSSGVATVVPMASTDSPRLRPQRRSGAAAVCKGASGSRKRTAAMHSTAAPR